MSSSRMRSRRFQSVLDGREVLDPLEEERLVMVAEFSRAKLTLLSVGASRSHARLVFQ